MKTHTRLALRDPHPRMGQLISSYQDGLATPEEADTVQRHLLECDICREFYGGLQEIRALVQDLPTGGPSVEHLDASYQAVLSRVGPNSTHHTQRKSQEERK
ncbi:MAG: anti-sigma factor family protein [Chloroflexia bacterium]